MVTAEQIVRALAAKDDIIAEGMGVLYCPLCGDSWRADDVAAQPSSHRPDCPWRLAVEWAAAQDGRADTSRAAIMVDVIDGEETRRRALERFGPQFDIPAGVTVSAVYVQAPGAGPTGVALEVPPVTGPGWFYFDADSRRLLPYPARVAKGGD